MPAPMTLTEDHAIASIRDNKNALRDFLAEHPATRRRGCCPVVFASGRNQGGARQPDQ